MAPKLNLENLGKNAVTLSNKLKGKNTNRKVKEKHQI